MGLIRQASYGDIDESSANPALRPDNSASDNPPDRFYEIMEGGMVFAPDINMRISTNIFRPLRSRGKQKKDKNSNPIKKPHFIPVCIDGRLIDALIHAPKVTIEEVR